MHALIDMDTNELIAYIFTTDKMGNNTAFRMLTNTTFTKGHVFDMIYVDSAHEAEENWKNSVKQGYMLVVKFKSNCNEKSNGCMARGVIAREYLAMPYDKWRKKVGYGRRWKSEFTFSDFKRIIRRPCRPLPTVGSPLRCFLRGCRSISTRTSALKCSKRPQRSCGDG